MNVLGLDSATEACSAAVLHDGTVAARRFETMQRGHAEVLMPLVRDVMRDANMTFGDIDLIAATVGPGGFTGLRIGLASARALALAAAIPLVGVTTLEAVAKAQAVRDMPVLIALDSKRDDIYVQLFDGKNCPLCEPGALLPPDIAGLLPAGDVAVAGNAAEGVLRHFSSRKPPLVPVAGPALPDAAIVASIGMKRFAARTAATASPPRALYLRAPDARLPGAKSA